MSPNDHRLEAGVRSLETVRGILGDKFGFADLVFFTDKNTEYERPLTTAEYAALRSLGWQREGHFFWRPDDARAGRN